MLYAQFHTTRSRYFQSQEKMSMKLYTQPSRQIISRIFIFLFEIGSHILFKSSWVIIIISGGFSISHSPSCNVILYTILPISCSKRNGNIHHTSNLLNRHCKTFLIYAASLIWLFLFLLCIKMFSMTFLHLFCLLSPH